MRPKSVHFIMSFAVATMSIAFLRAQDRYPVRQLSSGLDQEGFPSWSPDGMTVVFENVERGHFGLFKVAGEGGDPVRFTSFIGEHPKWSPDGQYIVFDADEGNSIKLISSHGGRPVRIVPQSIPVFRGGNPVWSPDGSRIAFKSDSALWILEIESGALTRAFDVTNKYPIPSCWSRDGRNILVILRDQQSSTSAVWRISPTGESTEVFAPVEGKAYRYLDESPDGSLIVFTLCEGRSCDLWVAPVPGGKAVQLTMNPSYDDTPCWSPDGMKIAFTSARTGKMDIYVMEVDLDDLRKELKALNE